MVVHCNISINKIPNSFVNTYRIILILFFIIVPFCKINIINIRSVSVCLQSFSGVIEMEKEKWPLSFEQQREFFKWSLC